MKVSIPPHVGRDDINELFDMELQPLEQVELPANLSFHIMGEPTFIHWLANWAKAAPSRELSLLPSIAPEHGDVSRPYMTASTLSSSRVVNATTGENLTRAYRRQLHAWFRSKQADLFSPLNIWNGYSLFCVDSSDFPLPDQLYQSVGDENSPRPLHHFQRLFREFTTQENSIVPIFTHIERGLEEGDIPRVVYELFRNTHDHATSELDGRRLGFSLRGVYVRVHEGNRDRVVGPGAHELRQYFNNVTQALSLPDNGNLTLLEIAVFDSGPGLAAHRAYHGGIDISAWSVEEELRWFEECFRKHSTGVPTEDRRGLGLEEVQRAVSALHGFLAVRSGRLFLYRDFAGNPYRGNVEFRDTTTRIRRLHAHARAAGALFSIILPCRRLS